MSPTVPPNEFFTWATLATYAGAVLAVWLATNVTRYVTGYDARWIALAWAVVVQLLVWLFVMDRAADNLVLALVNVLVVYVGATGGAAILGRVTAPRAADMASVKPRFAEPWW